MKRAPWRRLAALAAMAAVSVCGNAAGPPVLTLAPPNGPTSLAPAYFGIHVHLNGGAQRWPDLPVGSLRLWDARVVWPNLEPRPGEWNFARLDEYVAWAGSRGIEVLLPLALTPRWASARPDEPGAYGPGLQAEASDLAAWRRYVRTVVERYRGRIAAYQVWNEANTQPFFTGTPEALVRLTTAAAEEIRAADPRARVIAPSGVGLDARVAWPAQMLERGLGTVVDAAAYHLYHGNRPPEWMVGPALELQAHLARAGFARLPIWNTEFGYLIADAGVAMNEYESRNQIDAETAADYLPRDLLLAAALGYQRFYWYAWDNRKLGLLQPDGATRRRIADVYAQTIRQLAGASLQGCSRDAEALWTCTATDAAGHRLWALWLDPAAGASQRPLPAAVAGRCVVRLDGRSDWAARRNSDTVGPVVTLVTGSP